MARPRLMEKPRRVLCEIEAADLEALDAIAAERGLTRNALIRSILTNYAKRAKRRTGKS